MKRTIRPLLAGTGLLGATLLVSCGGSSSATTTPPVPPGLPTVNFQTTSQTIPEGGADLQLIVQLDDVSADAITVPFTVSGSATLGFDYIISASPLVIGPGDGGAIINLTMLADTLFEADETIEVILGTPTNGKLGFSAMHTVTVILGSGEFEPNNSVFDANAVGAMAPGMQLDITGRISPQGMMDGFDVFNFVATSDTVVGLDLIPDNLAADVALLISDQNGVQLMNGLVDGGGPGAIENTAVMTVAGQEFNVAVFATAETTDYTLSVSGAIPLLASAATWSTAREVQDSGLGWDELVQRHWAEKQLFQTEEPVIEKRSRAIRADGQVRRRADPGLEPGR